MLSIVGLGNPGKEYVATRHNVGFMIVDAIAEKLSLNWQDKPAFKAQIAKNDQVLLIKPQSYMNDSGSATRAVLDYFRLSDVSQLYVVHDDLDLELGVYKTQFAKGPHGHNGLLSLYQHLGSKAFWHVRVGVDGRAGLRVIPSDKYVLSAFEPGERRLQEVVVEQVTQSLLQLLHASL